MIQSLESHEKVIRKACERNERAFEKVKIIHEKVMRKLWENHEKVIRMLWGICEKVVRNSCESHDKFLRKSWESHYKVMITSIESHEKVMRKSWESHEKVMKKSWESHNRVLTNSATLLQLQTLQTWLFLSVLTQPLRIEMSPNETVGTMTMVLPFRQKAMVKTLLKGWFSKETAVLTHLSWLWERLNALDSSHVSTLLNQSETTGNSKELSGT